MRIEITNIDLENDAIDVDFEDACGTLVNFRFKLKDVPLLKKLIVDLESNFRDMKDLAKKEAE